MKRFYKLVSIEKVQDGYYILLDDRPVKTKAKAFLCAPNKNIALRLMQEWDAQTEDIIPDSMPFTQILNTQIDRVSAERDVMCAAVLKYLNTDLLCYPAAQPEGLVTLQHESWQPFLDGFESEFGYVLRTTTSLEAVKHPVEVHEAVARYVYALDDAHFTILQLVTSVSGSLIIALAVLHGSTSADDVLKACFVEETFKDALYNAEKYGSDPMLEKAKKAALQDFKAAEDYISFL
ncbi:MAG: ATP12 chaperone family protein [Zetaproteobacteria bacterium]|nr:MAG: ATP12 chaperone family protein [Zetaproteobacteria bacterium]